MRTVKMSEELKDGEGAWRVFRLAMLSHLQLFYGKAIYDILAQASVSKSEIVDEEKTLVANGISPTCSAVLYNALVTATKNAERLAAAIAPETGRCDPR